MEKPNYIDLFAGVGGLSLGFNMAGFDNLYSIEYDEVFAKNYTLNFPKHKMFCKDITKISNSEIKKITGNHKVDVIIGGPPCQGFSLAGNIGRNFLEDPRNFLFKEFVRFVSVIKPKVFLLENVAALARHNSGKTLKTITEEFSNIGYEIKYRVLNTKYFNIPQERRRIVIIGTLGKNNFEYPEESKEFVTIKEAIDDLPALGSGQTSSIPNHNAMTHSEQMLEKMSYVKDGGNRLDIPEKLRPKSGDARKYIRYDSTKPSICITGDMRKVFHYSQNRALTNRELARIQTFPDSFKFEGNNGKIQQAIGNAVPPHLAYLLASQIRILLFKEIKYPKINYIGNKFKLVDWIIGNLPVKSGVVVDLFAGGSSVSFALKQNGFKVLSNEVLFSDYVLSKAIVENKKETLSLNDLNIQISEKDVDKKYQFISKYLSNVLYYDFEVKELAELICVSEKLDGYKKHLLLSLIRRAMIRKLPYSRMNVPWNQIQKLRDENYSYAKYGRKRAYHNLSFKQLITEDLDNYNNAVFDNFQENKSFNMDAFDFIKSLNSHVDVIYMDPPYPKTMNKYGSFYGLFDKILKKEIKYVDFSENNQFLHNFVELVKACIDRTDSIVISLNNKTNPSILEIRNALKEFGKIQIIEKEHQYKVTNKENKNTTIEQLLILRINKKGA